MRDWNNDSITNAIYDDDLSGYLEQLRAKGASVLIVFDCCHAGSMSRGVGDERVRSVKPQDLGVPDDAIEKAVRRAKEEFAKDSPAAERCAAARNCCRAVWRCRPTTRRIREA